MKKLLLVIACVALSGCQSLADLSNVGRSNPVVASVCGAAQGTLIDEKVVYAAEVLYNIPAQAYVSADKNGKLSPELKATLKPLLVKMNSLRKAIEAGQGAVNCDFENMKQLQVQVLQLLPRN